LLCKFWLS